MTELEERYVLEALRSGYVAPLGPHVDEFERRVADRTGVAYAVALSSGTAALHLGLLALGCGRGTDVVLPSMTFAATANAVVYTGARPVFIDSQESDGNVDVDLMVATIDSLRAQGRHVAAAISVDLFGRCANYSRLVPLLAERGVPLIEDAAEALGAHHLNIPAGSFGDCAALSFNGNKIVTTSGGGMLLTNTAEIAARARYLSTQARQPVPWYEHTDIGYNYRLSNILAAIGIAQLARLDAMIDRRRHIRDIYEKAFSGLPGIRILGRASGENDAADNCWLTSIVLDPAAYSNPPHTIIDQLNAGDIECRHFWKPLHLQKVFSPYPAVVNGTSEHLFSTGINLPSGSALNDVEVESVSLALLDALR